jgi:hypothetical protein
VAVSGVLQDPSTYSVSGTTLTFSVAPPTGTGNISVRYLGIPATGVTTTAYRTVTEFTATASQTTFTPPSYTVGFLNVYRNGVLLGSADYTASNGTTVVLATGCIVGDLVTTESFLVSSVLNAIPNTTGSISSSNLPAGLTITTPTLTSPAITGTPTVGGQNLTPYTMKNRFINGGMAISQRNGTSSASFSAGAITYGVDRFFLYPTGAAVTGQQVTGTNTGTGYAFRITGATGNTACNFSQRIENLNTLDLNSTSVTISFKAYASTSISNIQVAAFCGTSANTGYGSGSNAFSSIFSLSSGLNTISQTITLPATASNGFELAIGFGSGIGNGVTVDISNVQLEVGSYATPFEWRPYGMELQLCQRYLPAFGGNGTGGEYFGYSYTTNGSVIFFPFPVLARTAPTSLTTTGTFTGYNAANSSSSATFGFNTADSLCASVISNFTSTSGTPSRVNLGAGRVFFNGCEL